MANPPSNPPMTVQDLLDGFADLCAAQLSVPTHSMIHALRNYPGDASVDVEITPTRITIRVQGYATITAQKTHDQ